MLSQLLPGDPSFFSLMTIEFYFLWAKVLNNVDQNSPIFLLQPSWFVGLLCSLLPQPNEDWQVQGAPVDDGCLPKVNHHVNDLTMVIDDD